MNTTSTASTSSAPKTKAKSIYEAFEIPTRARGTSELAEKLKACPKNKSFLEAVVIPSNTVASEKDNVTKEASRKLANRVSGAIRRFVKSNEGFAFEMRTVNDAAMGTGVRVWRTS